MRHEHSTSSGRPGKPFTLLAGTLLFLLLCAGCDREELIHAGSEKEATRILVELASRNVFDARKELTTDRKTPWLITVTHTDLNRAREVLVTLNLPHDESSTDESAGQSSLIPSAADDQAKNIRAIEAKLTHTLEAYDGVVEARVHIVIPTRDLLHRAATTPASPKAVVLLKRSGSADPDHARNGSFPSSEQVQQIVAQSVEGISAKDVDVLTTVGIDHHLPDMPARAWYADPIVDATGAGVGIGILATVIGFLIYQSLGKRGGVQKPAAAKSIATAV